MTRKPRPLVTSAYAALAAAEILNGSPLGVLATIIHGSRRSEHLDAGTALALNADDIHRIDPAGH